MSYVAYLDPQIASIGVALIAAIAALFVIDDRHTRRIQSTHEEGQS